MGGSKTPDIAWLHRDGEPMTPEHWTGGIRTMGVFLNGHGIPELDALGEQITDDSFLLLFNAAPEEIEFVLPDEQYGQMWEVAADTADPLLAASASVKAGTSISLTAHSLLVLRCRY